MNPGELNCRVIIQKIKKTDDNQGGYSATYETRANVWAKIIAITARTKDEYEQINPEILHRIVIRYRADVAFSDRVLYGNRVFVQISPAINSGEKNAFLRLECREVVSDAN